MADEEYDELVQRLRDVTVNIEAVNRAMLGDGIAGLDRSTMRPVPIDPSKIDPRPIEEQFAEVLDLAEFARDMEDVAVLALWEICEQFDPDQAVEAIEEAGAEWVYEALFRRAADDALRHRGEVPGEGGDA